jgi:hypothetical protein
VLININVEFAYDNSATASHGSRVLFKDTTVLQLCELGCEYMHDASLKLHSLIEITQSAQFIR